MEQSESGGLRHVLSADLATTSEVRATVRTRVNFAVPHLFSAAHFSRRVGELERVNQGAVYGPFFDEILANATASIFTAVASLEAYANELFIDRSDHFPQLSREVADRFWELYERKEILRKFELAALLLNRTLPQAGESPVQDVKTLISLRNALTHFKPEWEDERSVHDKVSTQLQARRIEPTPFHTGESGLFPRRWASHSCTKWAIRSCLEFDSRLSAQLGLPSKYNRHLHLLDP
jgi:hypothetical protein